LAGCTQTNVDCYPLKKKIVSKYYEDAYVDWEVYENIIGYGITNQWGFFEQFQEAEVGSSLYIRGVAFTANNTLETFYAQAANGTMSTVSWIMPPLYLSEHAPNTPKEPGFRKTSLRLW
jgi:phospholipase C